MEWFRWFGRWADKDRAYARLKQVKEKYGGYGDRVIKLSARTDLARRSAGSTQKAFDFVERAFAEATGEYARIMGLVENVEAGLAKGKVGDFMAIEAALKGMGPKLDELDRHLTSWESKWQQVPVEIESVKNEFGALRMQVESAVAAVGAPLPLSERLATMAQHLEKTQRTLLEGNPVEAGHLVDELRLAIAKVGADASQYVTGAGAIAQAEREVTEAKERLASVQGPADAVAALGAAEALLPRLRPSLAAGKLEHFQADLLQIQRHLAAVRTALKA